MAEQSQWIEQTVKKQVTIAGSAKGTASIPIPIGIIAKLKGYGYSYYSSTIYKLGTGNITLPQRTDQEGSASIPRIFASALPCRSGGNVTLRIENNDGASHTYEVVFYFLVDRVMDGPDYESVGGELIVNTGSGSSGAAAPETLKEGTKTAGSSSAPLTAATSTITKMVTVQADSTNGDKVFVGNSTNQRIELLPGQGIDIYINDLNKVYVKRNGSSDLTVNYLGS